MKKTLFLRVGSMVVLFLFTLLLWPVQAQEICWNINPTPLPTPTGTWHCTVVHSGKIYIIGGTNLTHYAEKVFFANINPDGTVGSWSETTPLPEPRAGNALVWNNFVYVIGGYGPTWEGRGQQNTVFYASINADGTIGEWGTTKTLPERTSDFASVVKDGRIYVMGGYNGFTYRDEVYFAPINSDGSLGDWQTTTPLPQRYCGMSGLAYRGTVYVIGGIHAYDQSLRWVYKASINQDGTLGNWQEAPPLPEARSYAGVALSGENVYVVGGQGPMGTGDFHKTVYRANIQILDWMEIFESLPEQRQSHSLVTFQGRLYVIGGDASIVDGHPVRRDTIYYSSTPTVPAIVDIDPDTLNLKSNGQWITAYISLLEAYSVEDIVPDTVCLAGIPAAWSEIQDSVYMGKFDRATVQTSVADEPDYDSAPKFYDLLLVVTGELVDGTPFEGSDTITVLKK